ncbi:MAG: hypothetical protein GEU73_10810 [Chloroflexi bacterium]|nr:hypothetical protein [Chloroflexota bacterium]
MMTPCLEMEEGTLRHPLVGTPSSAMGGQLAMSERQVHECECPHCQQAGEHPDKARHHRMNLFLSRLDEQQRRWYVALEAERLGTEGDRRLAQITGLDERTIRRGREELLAELADRPTDRVRQAGAGRPPVEKKIH